MIATTRTGRDGRYVFDQFGETGDYRVRITPPAGSQPTTPDPRAFLIPTGDTTVRDVNFAIRPAPRAATTSAPQVVAGTLPAWGLDSDSLEPGPRRHR